MLQDRQKANGSAMFRRACRLCYNTYSSTSAKNNSDVISKERKEHYPVASENSFDIVSDFDRQELVNALDQARREVGTRYDLKDTGTVIDLSQTELSITTDSEMSLRSVRDIIETKMLRRNLSLKILDFGTVEHVSGGRIKQTATLRKGIDTELAKKLQKLIRDHFPKVQGRIQGDTLRIVSKSRDELQAVIQFMREQESDLPVPLQYTNYR